MNWTIVGPECPECGHNEGKVIGQLMTYESYEPEKVVGQKIRCRYCDHSYNSYTDPKYDPDYNWYASSDQFGKQGFDL